MNKTIFNYVCSILTGFIAGAVWYAIYIDCTEAFAIGLLAAVFTFIALIPAVTARIKHICCELDWAEETAAFYHNIPAVYRKSFWLLFGFTNLAFLFHTVNFMWGADDWAAVRSAVNPEESLKHGRFAAYWLQELLFDGKILPVANNLWAFLGLSLAGVMLAVYWNVQQKTTPIVIVGLFFAVTPYTLSWLYSAKNTLGMLWLPAISLSALLLADVKSRSANRTYIYNLLSVLLFIAALGTYFPVINFIIIAILGRIFLKTVYADISMQDACLRTRQSLVNLTAALMMYILIEFLLEETGVLQTKYSLMAPFIAFWFKIPALFYAMFAQFATPLPFIDITYKMLQLLVVLMALFSIIFKAPNIKASLRGLALIPFILIASQLSFLFSLDMTQTPVLMAHVEFFSLPLIYALMLVALLKLGGDYLRRVAYTLAVLIIFMGFVRVAYAQKVWKFGWDAETKFAERIITRLEKMPEFNIERQYKLLQIGEMSLRQKYYLKKPYEKPSSMLLDRAYYPEGAAKDAYNFYYQTDFLSEDATIEAAHNHFPIKEYLLNRARAWPAAESLWIYEDYIIMVINEMALAKIRKALSES